VKSEPPRLLRAIPLFPAPRVSEAVAFYRDRLGFEPVFELAEYAGVARQGIEIHFWQCGDRRIAENTSCRIEVENIDALYAECIAADVIHPNGRLEEKPWGFREFSAVDEFGNLLVFVQRAMR
jgi:catechol 2,3-dioxygenase-like lactoylglutathione lyase family enzyme